MSLPNNGGLTSEQEGKTMIFTKKWWRAALIRALKTVAQTAVGMIPAAVTITQVDWLTVAGAAALAGAVSLLTSLAGLPEVEE
jgi:hypothetical protein